MWISPAYAQAAGDGGSGLFSLLPLVLIFVVFYILLIRPQQKKVKAHKMLVEALGRGDRVVTGGGLMGTVSKVIGDNELQVEIAEGVRVRVVRHTIQEVVSKSEPADKKDSGHAAKSAKDSKDTGTESGKGTGKGGLPGLLGGLFGGAGKAGR